MKIIALHHAYRGDTPAAIVELSGYELDKILSEKDHARAGSLSVGQTVEISKRWGHLREIESNIADAKKLPAKLRTLADMLDMNVPAITDLVDCDEVSA